MSGLLDFYLKGNILRKCEESFNDYLKEEGREHEVLLSSERKLMEAQLHYLLNMITDICAEHEDEFEGYAEVIDKLVGFCMVSKMNECVLCRTINNLLDERDGIDDGDV